MIFDTDDQIEKPEEHTTAPKGSYNPMFARFELTEKGPQLIRKAGMKLDRQVLKDSAMEVIDALLAKGDGAGADEFSREVSSSISTSTQSLRPGTDPHARVVLALSSAPTAKKTIAEGFQGKSASEELTDIPPVDEEDEDAATDTTPSFEQEDSD